MEKNEYFNEIINFIKDNRMEDIFKNTNEFYELYNCNLYVYVRVSTESQDFGRQLLEIHKWAKKKNITIYIENIYCDKYTGKTLKRHAYKKMRAQTKKNDYIMVSEVSRLGRTWDDVKIEWYQLKAEEINVLVMDSNELSAELPNEEKKELTVDKKFIQELVFNGVLYAACKKIEEVSKSTKAGMEKARLNGTKSGKPIGKPRGKYSNDKNFLKVLSLQVNKGMSLNQSLKKAHFPKMTYYSWLKKYKEEFGKDNIKDIYNLLKYM